MINIAKGRYWDKPWSLVDGCTPCSPGCDNCWSAGIEHRFRSQDRDDARAVNDGQLTTFNGKFNGLIRPHPERLDIPLRRRKPTVYAVWNDLWHEGVDHDFRFAAYNVMVKCLQQHTFLVLTKRHQIMHDKIFRGLDNVWHGLTVCNQQEADEKIPVFLQVPGKKFLSIEPMLGAIDFSKLPNLPPCSSECPDWCRGRECHGKERWICAQRAKLSNHRIDAVILGGEAGPGARPMHPDWVSSVRDQCATAGVPFFFKSWGEWAYTDFVEKPIIEVGDIHFRGDGIVTGKVTKASYRPSGDICALSFQHTHDQNDNLGLEVTMRRVGKKVSGRLLDGRTHDDLPWRKS